MGFVDFLKKVFFQATFSAGPLDKKTNRGGGLGPALRLIKSTALSLQGLHITAKVKYRRPLGAGFLKGIIVVRPKPVGAQGTLCLCNISFLFRLAWHLTWTPGSATGIYE